MLDPACRKVGFELSTTAGQIEDYMWSDTTPGRCSAGDVISGGFTLPESDETSTRMEAAAICLKGASQPFGRQLDCVSTHICLMRC